jgi:hypothetical protein
MGHGVADGHDEVDPRAGAQIARAAPGVDALPVDELHHEIRHAFFGRPSVEESGDVRVVEAGEHTTLEAEPIREDWLGPGRGQQLDGDALLEVDTLAPRLEDDAHAAPPDLTDDAIRADPPALGRVVRLERDGLDRGRRVGRRLQEIGVGLVRAEQGLDLRPHDLVVAPLPQPCVTLGRRPLASFIEETRDARPVAGRHGVAMSPFMCRRIQVLATSQSRFTVEARCRGRSQPPRWRDRRSGATRRSGSAARRAVRAR